jgi:hypothetical protein
VRLDDFRGVQGVAERRDAAVRVELDEADLLVGFPVDRTGSSYSMIAATMPSPRARGAG